MGSFGADAQGSGRWSSADAVVTGLTNWVRLAPRRRLDRRRAGAVTTIRHDRRKSLKLLSSGERSAIRLGFVRRRGLSRGRRGRGGERWTSRNTDEDRIGD